MPPPVTRDDFVPPMPPQIDLDEIEIEGVNHEEEYRFD
jgi:hypothetical protein